MAPRWIGGCVHAFVLGVIFDVIGLTVLLVGAFANLHRDGQFYGDFLVYTGSIVVFFSLMWWVLWYTGNVRNTSDEVAKSKRKILAKWAHKISTIARPLAEDRRVDPVLVHTPDPKSLLNPGVHGYDNAAFDRSPDLSVLGKKIVELDLQKKPHTNLNEMTINSC